MPDKFYSRPRDMSLQAYKDWINGIVARLNPDAKDSLTEEEWVKRWEAFQSNVEGTHDDSVSTISDS